MIPELYSLHKDFMNNVERLVLSNQIHAFLQLFTFHLQYLFLMIDQMIEFSIYAIIT